MENLPCLNGIDINGLEIGSENVAKVFMRKANRQDDERGDA